tara:strand:+ start:420 stop:644 length:225 start_codon:yes stop_codon:yes gene_type:complete
MWLSPLLADWFGRDDPTVTLTLNPLVGFWDEDVFKLVAVHEIVDCDDGENKSNDEPNTNDSNAIGYARYDVGCC